MLLREGDQKLGVHSFIAGESPIRPPAEFSNRRTNHALVQEQGRISAAGTIGNLSPTFFHSRTNAQRYKFPSRRPRFLSNSIAELDVHLSCGAGGGRFVMQNAETGVTGIYWERSIMSTLTRRACYKCGNVGHYAGEWYSLAQMTCAYSNMSRGLFLVRASLLQL